MSAKIGHFEILSELAKSPTSVVYKANDPQSGQTVALKAIPLRVFGDSAGEVEHVLLQEVESTKNLSSPGITPLFGAGEIEGQFCAAMEYVQGNSVATMLARKEGFSIWDLLDIGRQVCGALDHAHSMGIFHHSLEPAKVMCGWDGTVRLLGFGVSRVGNFVSRIEGPMPSILHYMSPEQIRGEAVDSRSNLFTLGAIFYEMVSDRKAFDRDQADALKECILDSTPVPPAHANPKVNPVLSDLIMKALAKDPAERYQRARDLLDDLEKCKESKPQASKKPAEAVKPNAASSTIKATGGATSLTAKASQPSPFVEKKSEAPSADRTRANPRPQQPPSQARAQAPAVTARQSKATAAAAGVGAGARSSEGIRRNQATVQHEAQVESPKLSSAVTEEPQVETFAHDGPKIAVDPLMAEGAGSGGAGTSFSDITELPPLKEVYVAPPPPPQEAFPPAEPLVVRPVSRKSEAEAKPRSQPREVAEKAFQEIRGVPPRLVLYSVAAAVGLILIVIVGLMIHFHNASGEEDSSAPRPPVAAVQSQTVAKESAPEPPPKPVAQPVEESPAPQPAETSHAKARNARKRAAPVAAPVVLPGQIAVDSTPAGAQIQIDGRSDPTWIAPFTVSGLQPGQHSVTVSKPGYVSDTRTVAVTAGMRSSFVVHLSQLTATLVVKSDPAGASVYVDGRDMGKITPAQIGIDKGQHVILLRKMGYVDETTSAQFSLGQITNVSQTLRPLGNVDNMKTVGKMKKLFGGSQGMAALSIHTQPKGAQISVNQHMLEKTSPVEVMLDPGNYEIDITLSGYAPIRKAVSVEKGGKTTIDETMRPQ